MILLIGVCASKLEQFSGAIAVHTSLIEGILQLSESNCGEDSEKNSPLCLKPINNGRKSTSRWFAKRKLAIPVIPPKVKAHFCDVGAGGFVILRLTVSVSYHVPQFNRMLIMHRETRLPCF